MTIDPRLVTALADRYRIEREVGQGGMATVYLAQDLKHDRKVAVKVLRPQLAATLGPERFAREIAVAARLQHPHILGLLDSGEASGFFYYVMPFVEGETLRDRIARSGELPVPDAVRLLSEIAEALAVAHKAGVVHRDIKPDNILLSGRHALVMDFGIAKAVTEASGRQHLTTAGVALGTPAYMAPEQASADPHMDGRVDIYALGVVGYEMLTGHTPFHGLTPQQTLAAHVTQAPAPVGQQRAGLSQALEAVVMKCLAKRPADRYQTADELALQLEPLATPSGGMTPTQTRPAPAMGRLPRWVPWAAGATVLAVVALAASQLLGSKPLNITVSDITPVTKEPGVEFQPAISPGGNEVAYVAGPIEAPELFVRSTVNAAGGASVPLGDTAFGSEWFPSWSRDGQSVRFWGCPRVGARCSWSETGKLGGGTRPVTLPLGAQAVTWSSDGARVAFVRGDTIFASRASDTVPRQIAIYRGNYSDLHSLAWSPDGKEIVYVNGNPLWLTSANNLASSIWVISAKGGVPREIAGGNHLNVSPAWLDARHLLFVSNRDGPRGVYVVGVGPKGARGEPRIVPGVTDPHSISYSISARRLVYAKFTLRQNVWAYPLNSAAPISVRDGRPVTAGSQVIEMHDVSPDGRWLAFDSNVRGNMDLYKMPLGGGAEIQLTDTPQDEFQPRWSPDGKEIAFYNNVPDVLGRVMLIPADGGPQVAISRGPYDGFESWSPTGLAIAFWSPRGGVRISTRDSVAGAWHEPVSLTDIDSDSPIWAPDGSGVLCLAGNDLAFVSPQGRTVWRRDISATLRLSSLGRPAYSRNGREIYVAAIHRDGRQGIWALPVAGGVPRLMIAFDDPALTSPGFLSVGPDRLYLTVSEYESDIWVANLRW